MRRNDDVAAESRKSIAAMAQACLHVDMCLFAAIDLPQLSFLPSAGLADLRPDLWALHDSAAEAAAANSLAN